MVDLAYVIPAYNSESTVGATVRSVLAQRGASVIAVVVDDGSSDSTGDAARAERDWRVEVVRQANQGLSGARNTGFEIVGDRAAGVCFLDADDAVDPTHAASLVQVLGARAGAGEGFSIEPGADLACCGYRMLGPMMEDVGWSIDVAPSDLTRERLLEYNPLAVGAVAVRTSSLRALAGERPFDQTLPVLEDWDLWLRLTAGGACWGEPVHRHLFDYRMRGGSLSRGVERMWRVGQRVLERAWAGLSELPAGAGGQFITTPAAPPSTAVGGSDRPGGALRRWTIRNLARAGVAAPDAVAIMLADLDRRGGRALDGRDVAALTGSLRHAAMGEHAIGPSGAMEREEGIKATVMGALASWPESHGAIAALSFSTWDCVADRLARLLRCDGRGRLAHLRPVVAGMGRNGRALAQAMAARGVVFEWYDQDEAAQCPVRGPRRLGLTQIGPRHLAIVTPASCDALFERLQRTRALVMRAWELVEHRHEDQARRVA